MKKLIGVIVVIVIVVVIIAASGGNKGEAGPIKIGFIGPLTGDLANVGENAKAAVEIALDEINSSGGIDDRQVQVIYENDDCTGTGGVKAVNKLINSDKVVAILGSVCSPSVLSFAPIAEKAKVPVLAYCSTAPKISEAGDYIFRDVPSDLFQASYAAKYIYNTLGKKNAAIVNINNDWGLGLKEAFTKAFTELGGKIVMTDGYETTSKDLRTQLAKVKASGADVLYFPAFTDGAIAGIRQAKDMGVTALLFGADAWDDNKVWDEVGTVGDGAMFTRVGTNSTDSFKSKMKEKLGNDSVIYCSNYAHDGLNILADAIKRGSTTSGGIKDALYATKYEGGVSSPLIEFDANGDPKGASYIINQVKGGKPMVVDHEAK